MHIKPSILIVDDEHSVCDLLHDELSEQNYLCDSACDGNVALEKIKKKTFDVILLDIRLPGISGIELLKEISPNCKGTVLIMMTAVNDVDTAVKAMKLGAADYIVKPFDLGKIKSTISEALEKKTGHLYKLGGYYVLDDDEEDEFSEMNAIAQGVEAKLDSYDNHFSTVTERAIKIAKELEIDEEKILRWEELRKLTDKKKQVIIHKFNQNLRAQMMMGTMKNYECDSDSSSNIG